jgi:hypothetical protein
MERESIFIITAHDIMLLTETFLSEVAAVGEAGANISLMNVIVSRYCRSSDAARVGGLSFQHALIRYNKKSSKVRSAAYVRIV